MNKDHRNASPEQAPRHEQRADGFDEPAPRNEQRADDFDEPAPDDFDLDDGTGSDDDDFDIESLDPEFAGLLRYIEALATKAAKQINAERAAAVAAATAQLAAPSADPSTTEAPDIQEPGTDAYDHIHGIPHYEIE